VLQYITRDIAWGFGKLGHKCEVAIEDTKWTDWGEWGSHEQLIRFVEEFKPDAVVQVDGYRPAEPLPFEGPWICYVLDRLKSTYDKAEIAHARKTDLTVACCAKMGQELADLGLQSKSMVVAPAVNTDLYYPAPVGHKPAVDCCFISHLASGMPLRRLTNRFLVAWMALKAELTLALYGDGWEADPDTAAYAKGVVENGPAQREAYWSGRLQLHANEDLYDHMRLHEAHACGVPVAFYNYMTPHLRGPGEFDTPYRLRQMVDNPPPIPDEIPTYVDFARKILGAL
jgi:hypothetical protein